MELGKLEKSLCLIKIHISFVLLILYFYITYFSSASRVVHPCFIKYIYDATICLMFLGSFV